MKRLFNNVIAAVNPRQTIGHYSLLVIMALILGLASDAAAAEVLTGTRGRADNRAVINFETMVGLDQRFRSFTNEGQRALPPPMPLGTNADSRGAAAMAAAAEPVVAAAAPPPGGFTSQPSPPPVETFQGLDDNGLVIPPDTHGAVGPEHLMVALNRGVRIQDRNGAALSTVSLEAFWSTLRVVDAFDPKVLYDPHAQRWIMTTMAEARTPRSSVLIGVSQSSNPRGRWNLYRIDADGSDQAWADYPSIGFNKDWIVVTVNMFPNLGFIGRSYVGANIYAFDKQDLYANGNGDFTLFQDNSGRGFTLVPAVVHDPLYPTMHLIETDNLVRNFLTSSSVLRLSTITGNVGAEVLTLGTAMIDPASPWLSSDPFLLFTGSLPQLGSPFGIQGNDSRIQNVVYRNGSLWCTHHAFVDADNPQRSAVQWYQLSPSGSLIQHGRLQDTNSVNSYAYPSIAVNRNNDVLIGFSKFSTNIYPSAAYAFRSCDDPPGTFRSDFVYKPGEGPYFPFGFSNFFIFPHRWGDYSATVVDPLNDLDMWTIQEYAPINFGFWDTWWAKVQVNTACSQVGFALNEYSVLEGAPPGLASIEVLNLGGFPGSIDFATSDGTAVAGVDYMARNGTLTFAQGQTSTNFSIVILDDPFTNGTRTVNLSLFNPGGGANLGFLSNAVLNIEDDEAVVPPNVAGEFNFSAYFTLDGVYFATENETCNFPCGDDLRRVYTPERSAYGVLVTVVRTNGNTGRVMVDFETALGGSAVPNLDYTPVSGTLVFDHLQTSTNFLVRIGQPFFSPTLSLFSFVRLVLSNPRPAPEEEAVRPGFINPSLGPGSESGIAILKINNGFFTGGPGGVTSNSWINFERVNYRVDEYPGGPGGGRTPCGGWSEVGGGFDGYRLIAVNIVANAPVSGTMRIRTSDFRGAVLLNPIYMAGAEQAESPPGGFEVWNNPFFTDPTLQPMTNFFDYFSINDTDPPLTPTVAANFFDNAVFPSDPTHIQAGGTIVTFANECRKSVVIAITNDSTVEFNEDIVIFMDPRPGDQLIPGINFYCNVTVVNDDQPAGALDREWNPDGVEKSDPPFNNIPGANGFVNALAVQEDGKTILGGDFTHVNAKPRNRIARMDVDGTLDATFNPPGGADQLVSSIALYPTNDLFNAGKVLVAGAFSSMNNVSRRGIARLNPNGTLDTTFNPGNGVNVGGIVRSLALQPDGKILIAGEFVEYDDYPRSGFARLNADGSLDLSFDIGTGADGNVWAIGFTADPFAGFKVVVGGDFATINGEFRPGVAQLNGDGSVDQNFNPGSGVLGTVQALAVQTNGLVIIAGLFDEFNATRRTNIARLNTDGSLDTSFDPGTGSDDLIYSVVLQPDGKAMIGGIFTEYNGTRRIGLARLRYNGTLDTTFMDTAYNQYAGFPNALSWEPPNYIKAIALQPDGKVMVGGSFTTVGGNPSEDEELRNTWTVYTRQDKRTRLNIARLIGGITPGPGNAEFDEDLYYVDENAGVGFARLQRTDGRLGSLSAESTNITATAIGTETDPLNADFVSTNRPSTWSEHTGFAPRPRSVGRTGFIYFEIPILDDFLREGDEQMDLSFLRPHGRVTLGGEPIDVGAALGRDAARLSIADNEFDKGIFNFTTALYLTSETNSLARIAIIRTNGSHGVVSVDYITRPAPSFPATPGVDFWPVRGTLSFASGQTSNSFTIPITNDTLVEFDEHIELVLTNATGGARLPGGTQTSIALSQLRIVDNDFLQGRLNFAQPTFINAETDGEAVISVMRSGGSLDAVSVQYETVSTGGATPGSDYQTVTGTLNWASGESGPKTFAVPLLLDGLFEGDESLRLRLYNPRIRGVANATLLGAATNSTLLIKETDFPGNITFAQALYQADENAAVVTINLVRAGGIAGPGSVTFSALPDSAQAGSDFIPVTTNVTFAPGQIGAAVFITPVDDSQGDGNKSVTLQLSNPSGVGLGVLPQATLLLVDNESVSEAPGTDDTAFNLTTETDGPIYSMGLQTTNSIIDGRIVIAGDFNFVNHIPRSGLARLMTNGALDASFNVGTGPNAPARAVAVQPDGKVLVGGFFTQFNGTNRNGIARLLVDGTLDGFFNPGAGADNPVYSIIVQPDEKILVSGGFNRFNGVLRPMVARLMTNGIVDLSFNAGAGPNDAVYAVALQADGKVIIGGEFTTVDGVPRSHLARLHRNGSLDLSFDMSVGFDGPVRAILVQADGRIVVGGSFLNALGVGRSYLARLNQNGSLDAGFMSGLSGANDAVYTLAQQVDGRLLVGGDFTSFNDVTRGRITRLDQDGSTDTTINFGSGANAFLTSLLIQPDRKILLAGGFTEYDAQARLRIARIHGGSAAGPGALTFSQEAFKVEEAEGETLITVKRKGGTTGTVSVNFATADDTAISGTDYRGTNGTLVFPPGETVQGFRVTVFNNPVTNIDRVVSLQLSGYSGGATSGPQPSARLIIVNDESAIGFTQDSFTGNENAVSGNGTLIVRRTYATNNFLTINFATIGGGTATPGVDYLPTNGSVTFTPGELTRNFNVRLINDTNIEGNETVRVILTGATATSGDSVFLDRTNATLTIVEDDFGPGQLILERTEYSVREDGGAVSLAVVRTNGHTGVVSVRYRTLDNSAVAGFDYVPTNTVLAFADGETRKTVFIGVLEDNLMEGAETFTVQLSNPTGGAALGAPSSANVTIQDNDTNMIVSAGAFIVSESGPQNSQIDPGETVTLALGLQNIGTSSTSNLLATLQTTPNVSPQPPASQSYGVLVAGGDPKFVNYTFTASGPIGFRLAASLSLVDGSQSFGIVTYTFTLGGSATNVLCNTTAINIPSFGGGTPYPSIINVANVGGQITKVIATLNGFSHNWPQDVDVLLEGPNGQTVMLMSDAGPAGPNGAVNLSFDDKVANAIPQAPLTTGTYRPANYAGQSTSDAFPLPAPQPVSGGPSPYTNTAFSIFMGSNPNGAWKLYVVDDEAGDAGAISGGWCLTLVTGDPISSGADVVITGQDSPDPVLVGADLTYTYGITNRGPVTATAVTFVSPVPPKTTFISASSGMGAPSLVDTNVTHTIASLAPGTGTWLQYVVRASVGGFIATNRATVQSAQTDLVPANNTVQLTTAVQAPTLAVMRNGADVTLSWPAAAAGFVLQQSDTMVPGTWTDVPVQPSVVGNQRRITLRVEGTCRNYRLRKQ